MFNYYDTISKAINDLQSAVQPRLQLQLYTLSPEPRTAHGYG